MLNQFLKALILVIITAVSTYAILKFFPSKDNATGSSQVSKEDNVEQKTSAPETSNVGITSITPAEKDSASKEDSNKSSTVVESEQNIPSPTASVAPPSINGILPNTLNNDEKLKGAAQQEINLSESQKLDNTDLAMSADKAAKNATVNMDSAVDADRDIVELADKKPIFEFSTSTLQNLSPQDKDIADVEAFCKELSGKLRTVKYKGCLNLNLGVEANFRSIQDRSLTYRHFRPQSITESVFDPLDKKTGRILFISGIHGDEYSAISITYLWMLNMLKHQDKNTQHWLFLPLTNPDGLFKNPATRINANNVDLNRNFPSPDWDELALDYWKKYYKRNKRRYPGESSNSEPETQWLVHLIEEFKPDAIISVHAPYGLVDYDGPEHAIPSRIGGLKHRELGTYPGSLGRYAGEYLKIPVLTLELRAAGSMPSEDDIYNMWRDVEEWTITKIRGEDPGAIPNFKKVANNK